SRPSVPRMAGGADFGANAPHAMPTNSTAPVPSANPLRLSPPTRYPTAIVRKSAVSGDDSRIVLIQPMHAEDTRRRTGRLWHLGAAALLHNLSPQRRRRR